MKYAQCLFVALMLAVAGVPSAIAQTMTTNYHFDFATNQQFLDDLNRYTLVAPKIVFYGKSVNYYPARTGRPVTFVGRGRYDASLGGSGYAANWVIVGHPCVGCRPRITSYHVSSDGPDEVIAVYPK